MKPEECADEIEWPVSALQPSMHQASILIIDDDRVIVRILRQMLQAQFNVITASDGLQGLNLYRQRRPDLVLLDVNLPGLDGWEVLRELRAMANTPILMLTARQDTDGMVRGLHDGADDYMTKPFHPEVLGARIRALLRRVVRERADLRTAGSVELEGGRLRIDLIRAEAQKDGRPVVLSATEYRLLAFLAHRRDELVPVAEILAHVWGAEFTHQAGYVKSFIRLLRRKIEDDPSSPRYLVARRGRGYMLVSAPRD
jgi:DNA-binding response OmpR family regulator